MNKKYVYDSAVKLSKLIGDLKNQGIENFYIHHPAVATKMDATQVDEFIRNRPHEYVKLIYQDISPDKKSTYLYLGIDHTVTDAEIFNDN